MKDDTSTPTPEDSSPNEFETGKSGTAARDAAESAIEDLRRQGGVFVDAVRATRMPMALTDPNLPGNPIVFANEAFLKLTGYSMDEVLGQQPHFMNGPATDPRDAARFTEAIRADQDDIIETVQYRKNGTRFVATVLISAFKDERGHTLNHFMSWLDVTRRVDAEDEVADLKDVQTALRESEERYRSLFQNMGQGYSLNEIVRDSDGNAIDLRYIELNPAFERLTGASTSEARGRLASEAFPGLDRYWVDICDRAATRGAIESVEHEFTPNGRWYRANFYPIGDDRVLSLYDDISEQKRAELTLRESEERYRTLFETMGQGYQENEIIRDESGRAVDHRVLEANPRSVALTGVPLETMLTRTANEVFPDALGFWTSAFDRIVRSGKPERIEHEVGSLGRWYEVYVYPRGGDRFSLLFEDVTDRKQAEQALRESEQHAQLLLAELQHRVRNTLAVVRSIARRTAENKESAEEMLAHFQGRLDAFSRVQAALTRNPGARVDLTSLVEDELIAHSAREGQHVRIDGPKVELGPKTAERLSLAIHELTTNAVKHGALVNGHGRLDVRWKRLADGGTDQLELRWKESGVEMNGRKLECEGFGMELLRRTLPYDLQAQTAVELEPDGLRFELRLPLGGS